MSGEPRCLSRHRGFPFFGIAGQWRSNKKLSAAAETPPRVNVAWVAPTPDCSYSPPEDYQGRGNVPCEGDDDRWQPSKPDWGPWRVSCDNARATPVPIRIGTFRRGPMGLQTKCEIPLCRCGGRGARCRYAREFFPQAQHWVCEIGSHRSVPSPVLLFVVFPSFG
jgi:hypothetical protein